MHICERITAEGSQVDREAGVIRGVKLLGANSSNKRKYSPSAIEQAARMYEGAAVNVDHPSKPGSGERSVTDGIGWISNVTMKAGIPHGDLNILKSHPAAPMLLEAAERNPARFGMSHNADGIVEVKEGANVVTAINKVFSVDIVQNPATTKGFFESEQETTVADLLYEAGGDWGLILESDGMAQYGALPAQRPMVAGMPQQPPAAGEQPQPDQENAAVSAAFKTIAVAILDEPGDIKAKLKRLGTLLKTQEEIMGGGQPADPNEQPTEDPADPGDTEEDPMPADTAADPTKKKAPPVQESADLKELVTLNRKLLEKLEAREARDEVVSLLESSGREALPERITAMLAVEADKRQTLLESYPKAEKARPGKPARSAPANSQEEKYPETAEKFLAAIR